MVDRAMNKGLALLAVIAAGLAACHARDPGPAPLAGARIGAPFTLTDQDGRRFSSAGLAGRWPVIYFGYTSCPDVCPTDMQKLAAGLRLFEARDPARAAKVQPIFVSIDPARDTPPVLRQFVRAFSPRLIGLTGSEAQIAAVAKAFASPYRRLPPSPGVQGYLVEHSPAAMLFGPHLEPIALVPVDAAADPQAAADTLDRWVR